MFFASFPHLFLRVTAHIAVVVVVVVVVVLVLVLV
jgi:hypothetical protein